MEKQRYVKVSAVQCGPATRNKKENVSKLLKLIDKAALDNPDYVLFSELATTPYFCCSYNDDFFDWAEEISGDTVSRIGEKAAKYQMYIILPMFEKDLQGNYYNSAVVIGPNGRLVTGTMPNGEKVKSYKKNHIPASYDEVTNELRSDEKYYFKEGNGFPVFKTEKANIGILICWDKRYFEGWRSLALSGAEIIFNPIATRGRWRNETYPLELQVMGLNNQVFVVGTSKAGREELDGVREYVGGSYIVNSNGIILKQNPTEEDHVLTSVIDLNEIQRTRKITPMYRDRRPDLYTMLTEVDKNLINS